jgi:hypothetical protein
VNLRIQCLCIDAADPARLVGMPTSGRAQMIAGGMADPEGNEFCVLEPLAGRA